MSAPVERFILDHYDPATGIGEVVRGLARDDARRVVEHDIAAGRIASMRPEPPRGRGTYR